MPQGAGDNPFFVPYETTTTEVVFSSVLEIFQEAESYEAGRFEADASAGGTRLMFGKRLRRSLLLFISVLLFAGSSARLSSAQQGSASTFEDLATSAATARDAGKKEDAIRDYERAVEIRADWEEGWWYLGTMRYDSDHYAEAIPALQKVVQIDPALGPAWNFLGLCEFETRDYGNALKHLEKGQQLGTGDDPEIARVSRYHLALLLIRSGAFEKASSMIAAAFADQPPAQVKVALGLLAAASSSFAAGSGSFARRVGSSSG